MQQSVFQFLCSFNPSRLTPVEEDHNHRRPEERNQSDRGIEAREFRKKHTSACSKNVASSGTGKRCWPKARTAPCTPQGSLWVKTLLLRHRSDEPSAQKR